VQQSPTDAENTEITIDGLTLADMSFSSTTNILVSVEYPV